MRFTILFAIAALLLGLSACATDGGAGMVGSSERQISANGFPYIHHVDKPGDNITAGQGIEFHVTTRAGDSILFSTYKDMGEAAIQQLPAEEQTPQNPTPLLDAFKLMSAGDSLTVFYPLDSMPQRPAGMEEFDEIAYDIQILKVFTADEYTAKMEEKRAEQQAAIAATQARKPEIEAAVNQALADYKAGKLELEKLPSGLEIYTIEAGTGPKPAAGERVKVHYYGSLMDGTVFDNSFDRGDPFSFPLGAGQVIKGWDEGIAQLNQGAKAVLFIPSDLGYGADGAPPAIPGGADLAFYVELP